MKKQILLAAGLLLLLSPVCFGQRAKTGGTLQSTLAARENQLWEAWKNRQAAPFQAALSEDSVLVGDMGVANKAQAIQGITGDDCTVQSFTLSDWKLTMFDRNTALLTYKGTQTGTCGGTALPASVMASTLWVRRGGKWYAAFHQETPMGPQSAPTQ